MQSRFFRTRDGLRLHYLSHPCANADSNSYCILLHGFTNDAHVWDELAARLQPLHHVIALDLRGHGDSDWDPEHKYSHWQLAEDVQVFLQTLGHVTVHIVGHSLGARVALLAAENAPCPLASLTIIDAGPEVNPDAGDRLVNDVQQMPEQFASIRAYFDYLARIYVMADHASLLRLAHFGLCVSAGKFRSKMDPAFTPGVWHKNPEFRAMHKTRGELSEQIWKALAALTLPVHIVRGQASSILESSLATRMLRMLGDQGTLSTVPRAGHAVMLDNPGKSTTLIVDFINSINSINEADTSVRIEKELEYQV